MNLGLTLSCSQIQTLECSCCGQNYDHKYSVDSANSALIFGAVRYAICPVCLQEVEKPWSKSYMKKWELRVKEIKGANCESRNA